MDKETLHYLKNFGKYMEEAPEAIPDIEKLIDSVITFLQYINTEEMQKMEIADPHAFEKHLDNKFSEFTLRYYTVFKLLLDKPNRENNVARMLEIFQNLNRVKNSEKTMDRAYDEFIDEVNDEFIYSKYGGKDNFEKEMIKQNKLKQNKNK